jgi:raffinose/stachyose/melibiose transport system permease protein
MNINKKLYISRLLFTVPALFFLLIFVIYPFVASLFYSLTEWDGLNEPVFIGFENFVRLFNDPDFIGSIGNTVFYCVFSLLATNIGSLILALCLNMKVRGAESLRTIFYLPAVLSLAAVSVIWSIIMNYHGSFNFFLSQLGLVAADNKIDWIGNYNLSRWTISVIMLWSVLGYYSVFYLAGLRSIPNDIYEASSIDGAQGLKMFRFITLPLLMPSITVVTFLNLVISLKLFDLPYIMTNGGGGATTSMAMQVYVLAFRNGTFGYATAAGIVLFVFVSVISFTQVIFTRKKEVQY